MSHNFKNNLKNQLNEELILWKDEQDWQFFSQLTKIKRKRTQVNKIIHEKRNITTDNEKIQEP